MPVISLTTDFGLSDPYAGIMKGVIASICPGAPLIDLTHQIDPQDVHAAAYVLASACAYFPPDAVHVCVVDPGVGSGRRIVCVQTDAGRFLAPDNGVLGLVLAERAPQAVFSVENPEIFLHPVSRTFHGRDIFAPAAARLACGMRPEALGPAVPADSLVRLDFGLPPAADQSGGITGAVIAADRFGNLITNITRAHLEAAFGGTRPENGRLIVQVGNRVIEGIAEAYQAVSKGEALAIIGSTDRLEISVNAGSAAQYFRAGRGDRVIVRQKGGDAPARSYPPAAKRGA